MHHNVSDFCVSLNLKWKSIIDLNVTLSICGRDRPLYAGLSLREPKSVRKRWNQYFLPLQQHDSLSENRVKAAINQFHDYLLLINFIFTYKWSCELHYMGHKRTPRLAKPLKIYQNYSISSKISRKTLSSLYVCHVDIV